jgi:hypothetical protein
MVTIRNTSSRQPMALSLATSATSPSTRATTDGTEAETSFEPAAGPPLPGATGTTLAAAKASITWVGVPVARRLDEWCALGRELAAARAMPPSPERTARIGATEAALSRLTQSLDGPSLLATLRAGAGDRRLGFMVAAAGLENLLQLGASKRTNINDALAMSDTVKVRGLTSYEAQQVRRTFGDALDPATIRFNFTTGVQTTRAGALVIGNTINVDPSDRRWGLVPGTTLPANPSSHQEYNEVLLTHEMAHVWSYQHRGSIYAVDSLSNQAASLAATGDRGGTYRYTPGPTSVLHFNEEQRAMVLQDRRRAQDALARGEASVWLSGQGRAANPVETVRELQRYVDEVRASGPGQPNQSAPAVACVCHPDRFAQDGILGFVGSNCEGILGSVGPAIRNALVSGDVATTALGVVGVAVVAAGSLLSREQSGTGGGSDVFDQAGLPRGLSWNFNQNSNDPGAVAGSFSVRAAWDVQTGEIGFSPPVNPRVEVDASAVFTTASGSVSATASTTVGGGGIQAAAIAVSTTISDTTVSAGGALQLGTNAAGRDPDTTLDVNATVASGSVAIGLQTQVRSDDFGVSALSLRGQGNIGDVSFGAGAGFARSTTVGGLSLTSANAAIGVVGDGFGFDGAVRAQFDNAGLNALSIDARLAVSSLSVELGISIDQLLTDPYLVATLRIAGDWGSVRAIVSAGKAGTSFGVGFAIPLPALP